jgi:hypothetical protein
VDRPHHREVVGWGTYHRREIPRAGVGRRQKPPRRAEPVEIRRRSQRAESRRRRRHFLVGAAHHHLHSLDDVSLAPKQTSVGVYKLRGDPPLQESLDIRAPLPREHPHQDVNRRPLGGVLGLEVRKGGELLVGNEIVSGLRWRLRTGGLLQGEILRSFALGVLLDVEIRVGAGGGLGRRSGGRRGRDVDGARLATLLQLFGVGVGALQRAVLHVDPGALGG